MLIHRIGPRGADPRPIGMVQSVFEAAFSAGIRDSTTLHHFSLLLLDQERFIEAEDYAQQALDVLNDPYARVHFKTESRQNLHNTLGMVHAKHGLHLETHGTEREAKAEFQEAADFFLTARIGEFANSYPFYSESWMHLQRARNSGDTLRLKHLAAAFQIVDEAEGNISDEDVPTMKEMEAKLVSFMADIPNLSGILEKLQAEGDPSAQYLKARQAQEGDDSSYGVDTAYAILVQALKEAPEHVACLRMASRLHHQLFPEDYKGWKHFLDRRYSLEGSRVQCGLLFELGCAATQLAKYHEAWRFFEELEAESAGHPKRSGIVAVVKDRSEHRRFQGVVKNLRGKYEGWVQNELISREVKFMPVVQKFTVEMGQTVTFSLAMNYRGYLAIELRPE